MPRYIDADVAKEVLSAHEDNKGYLIGDFEQIIDEEVPTVDVVERRVGRWTERQVIEDGKAIEEWQSARCSVCGKYHTTPYLYYFDDFAYCPSCGAEMKGESDATVH